MSKTKMQTEEERYKPGEKRHCSVDELSHYEASKRAYGEDEDVSNLVARMEEMGFDPANPLTIDTDGTVTKGNRMLEAAREAGIDRVLVYVRKYESEMERREDAGEDNGVTRDPNPVQKYGAAKVLHEPPEKKKADERRKATQNNDSAEQEEIPTQGSKGQVRGIVADKADIGSGRTFSNLHNVMKAAGEGIEVNDDYEDVPVESEDSEEVQEIAKEQVEALKQEEQSITGAYNEVKEARKREEEEEEEQKEDAEDQSSQSDSKASDTGTQTDEGSDEGGESYNDDSDSEGIDGVPAHAEDKIPDESTATTTSTSESGVSDETETDSTEESEEETPFIGPTGEPITDSSDEEDNDDSEPERVTAVRESTGETVGANETDNSVGGIEEITPPDDPSEGDLEEIKDKTESLIDDLPDDIQENLKERSEELLELWEAHINMASYSHNLRCPVCGDDSLEYTCHHIKPDEALSLANQAYDNHLKGKEELEGTEYEDVAVEERGFDGKEQAPSFEEALKN